MQLQNVIILSLLSLAIATSTTDLTHRDKRQKTRDSPTGLLSLPDNLLGQAPPFIPTLLETLPLHEDPRYHRLAPSPTTGREDEAKEDA
jgi:hypothetical protein